MHQVEFVDRFEQLTGFQPTPWQTRLFLEYFDHNRMPAAVDIPTGLGKTGVIALWLIAVLAGRRLPRRLVYVVDRRAVVDQATSFVEGIRERLPGSDPLPVSTLRGQHIDNRAWLDDPAQPAIIVGTVDMVGSRLLFSGYGVSRKMRPYHAGLLGTDTLVVLDEAHLVPPFERLLEAVESGGETLGAKAPEDRAVIPSLRLLSLSATGRARQGEIFTLTESDLGEPGSLTRRRLGAKKRLSLQKGELNQRSQALADAAWALSGQGTQPMRLLVYCDSRDDAIKVCKALDEYIKDRRKLKDVRPSICDPELFIGARRGHERQLAADRLGKLGFLAGSDRNDARLRFLVATSAGEVGVDLDADHMVCDLVAWERMVQRLGRVNRRGDGDARIIVIDFGPQDPKSSTQAGTHSAVRSILGALPETEDGLDASPGALRQLKQDADTQLQATLYAGTTPAPLRPALNRPLVDAWSMTTLREHTGRPEVQPWLRGWVDEEPQTTIVWRAHLPIVAGAGAGLGRRGEVAVADYFEAAPPHAAEQLQTESYRVAEWLIARTKGWVKLVESKQHGQAEVELPALRAPRSWELVAVLLDSAGDFVHAYRSQDLAHTEKQRLTRELAGRTLIVRSDVGGLEDSGTLDPKREEPPAWVADSDERPVSDADGTEVPEIPWRIIRWEGSDDAEPQLGNSWHRRHQFVLSRNADGEIRTRLAVYQWRQASATEDDRALGYEQTLADHRDCAEERARRIAERLDLPAWATEVLTVAARLHDEGKQAERWQAAFHAPKGAVYAKTKGPIDQQLLDGYRHEFGSLFHAERDTGFQALKPDQQDLVLHLIAAHHGQARPAVSVRGCEEGPPSQLAQRARHVAVRFARLQRRWGPWGLAWWEALLRAADQQASKDAARGAC